jgi:hypothetical protein
MKKKAHWTPHMVLITNIPDYWCFRNAYVGIYVRMYVDE